jgi:AcrR family transcriptional regulator
MARSRDPERTRQTILAAARAEFSRYGLAGARVDRIAAAANLNKRMIYHYFGSKDGLWSALLAQPFVEAPLLPPAGLSLLQGLRAIADRLAAQPDTARLLVWEALEGRAVGTDNGRRARWSQRVAELIQAQRDGQVRGELDAAQLAAALTALVLFPVAFPQLTQLIAGDLPAEMLQDKRDAFFARLTERLAPSSAKPRVRLNAAVTRQQRPAQSRRQIDSNTSK